MKKYKVNCNCKYGRAGDIVPLSDEEAKRWGFELAGKDETDVKDTEPSKPKNKAMTTKDVLKK